MATAITKKVRMGAKEAQRLRRVARDLGLTESEVLRQGVGLMERVRDRHKNVDKLIALIDGPEPPKVRFQLR